MYRYFKLQLKPMSWCIAGFPASNQKNHADNDCAFRIVRSM